MTDKQFKVIGGLIGVVGLLALIAMLGFAPRPAPTQAPASLGLASVNGYEAGVKWFGNGFYAGLTQAFGVDSNGAVTSATTTNTTSYWSVGGIDYASVQVSLSATSSVPASIPNPFGAATSSITSIIAQITGNGITGATQFIDISTSTTALGTSSPALVYRASVLSGGQAFIPWQPMASSTNTTNILLPVDVASGRSNLILGPSENLNMKIASGTPGTFTSYYTGTFSATFMKP